MKKSTKDFTIKLLFYVLGYAIMAVAITFFLKANLGSDPITIFVSGLSFTFGTSYGVMSIVNTVVFLIISIIFARKYISVGTIVGIVTLGPLVDLFTPITDMMFKNDLPFVSAFLLMLAAEVLLCAAVGIIISVHFGLAGTEAVLFKITDISNFKFQHVKMVEDALFIIVGYLLGGVVGVGTVVSMICTGMGSVVFVRLMNFKVLNRFGLDCEENDMPIQNPFAKFLNKKTVQAN